MAEFLFIVNLRCCVEKLNQKSHISAFAPGLNLTKTLDELFKVKPAVPELLHYFVMGYFGDWAFESEPRLVPPRATTRFGLVLKDKIATTVFPEQGKILATKIR